jgi:fumarylacetoacetase
VVPSGTPIRRPNGQRKRPDEAAPSFGPCRNLDYELELGVWIGPGNALGEPIPVGEAAEHIAGYCLLNDWSARDIQAWEYQPLGPFLAKNFGSTVSPWVVTPEALAPFRAPSRRGPRAIPRRCPTSGRGRPARGRARPELEVLLLTPGLKEKGLPPHRLSLSDARHMYWTAAQMVAHHSCNGCNLAPGDLLGTGTISAPGEEGFGSLWRRRKAARADRARLRRGAPLPGGRRRGGGPRARARREGFATIGFGECHGASCRRRVQLKRRDPF